MNKIDAMAAKLECNGLSAGATVISRADNFLELWGDRLAPELAAKLKQCGSALVVIKGPEVSIVEFNDE